jgi:hypothetical protein
MSPPRPPQAAGKADRSRYPPPGPSHCTAKSPTRPCWAAACFGNVASDGWEQLGCVLKVHYRLSRAGSCLREVPPPTAWSSGLPSRGPPTHRVEQRAAFERSPHPPRGAAGCLREVPPPTAWSSRLPSRGPPTHRVEQRAAFERSPHPPRGAAGCLREVPPPTAWSSGLPSRGPPPDRAGQPAEFSAVRRPPKGSRPCS